MIKVHMYVVFAPGFSRIIIYELIIISINDYHLISFKILHFNSIKFEVKKKK